MDGSLDPMDRVIAMIDRCLRTCAAPPLARRASPAATLPEQAPLSPADTDESVRLMRVNHAGEVAAQALYHGQCIGARDPATRRHLEGAADEEADHLAWCIERLAELGGRPSYLVPLWYFGSFTIGLTASLAGDTASLGFVRETERQVEAHLDDHLSRLPENDHKSRAILMQMSIDEQRHGHDAEVAGGTELPAGVVQIMRVGGSILRSVARVL
jgi:3-demethoxyubiquinol 3-hydroxylase